MKKLMQPWIGKPATDIIFILLPPFLCLLVIALFPSLFQNNTNMPVAGWVVLILLVDVAHVYSTLYRTYFDPQSFNARKTLLLAIPFVGFIAGVILYSISPLLFWRLLAYVAVYHFIRQQYGFMRLYSRKEARPAWSRRLDAITIYAATIYPILYWHLSGPKNFNWFIENDFMYIDAAGWLMGLKIVYLIIVLLFLIKEFRFFILSHELNLPKLLVVAGTLLSWYFGIVYFNGDMAFTLLNVVSHGIPYMALVWLYGNKHYLKMKKGNRFLQTLFSRYGLVLFLGLLFIFAFVEEGLWDLTVWKEHGSIFGGMGNGLQFDSQLLAFIVPLLALPQITHYILDGFIWRIRKDDLKL